jgi:hypothetical protein
MTEQSLVGRAWAYLAVVAMEARPSAAAIRRTGAPRSSPWVSWQWRSGLRRLMDGGPAADHAPTPRRRAIATRQLRRLQLRRLQDHAPLRGAARSRPPSLLPARGRFAYQASRPLERRSAPELCGSPLLARHPMAPVSAHSWRHAFQPDRRTADLAAARRTRHRETLTLTTRRRLHGHAAVRPAGHGARVRTQEGERFGAATPAPRNGYGMAVTTRTRGCP